MQNLVLILAQVDIHAQGDGLLVFPRLERKDCSYAFEALCKVCLNLLAAAGCHAQSKLSCAK